MLTLRERVDAHTIRRGPDECWSWDASRLLSGRPRIGYRAKGRSRSITAARVVVAAEHGLDIDDRGWVARHSCDNLECTNPGHMLPGTYRENTADMWDRGRGARGDRRPSARLTVDKVRDIRARAEHGESQAAIASRHGIGQGHVSQVVRGVIWGWVE